MTKNENFSRLTQAFCATLICQQYLLPTYQVWREAKFSVCLYVHRWGGTLASGPSSLLSTRSFLSESTPHSCQWSCPKSCPRSCLGVTPLSCLGGRHSSRDRTGGTPTPSPRHESQWWYTAGSLPLLVTQEDFLVFSFGWIHFTFMLFITKLKIAILYK